ncbi:YnbE family lipoprotein [Arenibaculum pallidiluteum]|uniref:YnbE family lipoprotein n=1 Tax=Arenibaculum pallidiluteum TaxID=2812559 RepID=UPI002E2871EC|nr:YnbE family lipoprotein [Arenibaculum pallidiluteum]
MAGLALAGCQPTLRVEAPEKPIEINLNIRIEQEVRVKVERDLEEAFRNDPAVFGLPKGGTP